jgi:hypothetical protein
LVDDSEDLEGDGHPSDPPMTDYEKKLLDELRKIFARPYHVQKVPQRVNDSGLTWNPDFWVEKERKVILVIKALGPDTTLENLDARMRDAYAVLVLNWEVGRHGGALATGARALVVPDKILRDLGQERYLKYNYAFEPFGCEIIGRNHIAELELHRDEEDRVKRPIQW